MNLGENIYNFRVKKHMSQGDLAEALDVSRQSVSKWENNTAIPELEKLVRMAELFGITIDELVTGTTPESPAERPSPATPARRILSTQQILGIVLMAFGGLCLIVFTVVGIFTNAPLLGLCISLPFLACGGICLLCKENVGLKCGWTIFILSWLLFTIVWAR